MTTHVRARSLMVACALLAMPMMATAHPEVRNDGGIPYMSGGVGKDERKAMDQISRRFNLKLTLAVTTGHFLGDVPVRIQDARGNTILETVANGPYLFAQLQPGRYTVIANVDGQERTRVTQVASNKQTQVTLTWPAGAL